MPSDIFWPMVAFVLPGEVLGVGGASIVILGSSWTDDKSKKNSKVQRREGVGIYIKI